MASILPSAMQPLHGTRPARRLSKASISILASSINATLLHCAAILAEAEPPRIKPPASTASAPQLSLALSLANTALAVAGRHHLPELVAKAHLFRGHCLRLTGRWRGAHESYVRAASVRSFAADTGPTGLGALTAECAARAEKEEGTAKRREEERMKRRTEDTRSESVGGWDLVMVTACNDVKEVDWLAFGNDRGECRDCEAMPSRNLWDGRDGIIAHRNEPRSLRTVKGRLFHNLFSDGGI